MSINQAFVSLVMVARNPGRELHSHLVKTSAILSELASDYEIVIIDNGSTDDSIQFLKQMTGEAGLANLQVYVLTKQVPFETAAWAGVENALGDYVVVVDPNRDDVSMVPAMVAEAMKGAQVVFARNSRLPPKGIAYRLSRRIFTDICRRLCDIDGVRDLPSFRLVSRQVVNFIQQHPAPAAAYTWLPAATGFPKATLTGEWDLATSPRETLWASINRGINILLSTTHAPMRLVTLLCLIGAGSNLLYSLYIVLIAILKKNVAEGWVTLSLQQSGMFLLISLVLLILSEYVMNMANLSNEGPRYHIAQEFTSAVLGRRQKLNIEIGRAPAPNAATNLAENAPELMDA